MIYVANGRQIGYMQCIWPNLEHRPERLWDPGCERLALTTSFVECPDLKIQFHLLKKRERERERERKEER